MVRHKKNISAIFLALIAAISLSCDIKTEPSLSQEDHRKDQEEISFKKNPKLGSYWLTPPVIKVCKNSGVKKHRILRAISYWNRLGYEISYAGNESEQQCISGARNGIITVLIVNTDIQMGNNLAMTRTFKDTRTNQNVKAEIYIYPHIADRPLVLEHEIGHALGWSHCNSSYHIMNREITFTGHGSRGVRYSDYIRKIGEILAESY